MPGHANGLKFEAFDLDTRLYFAETFYSIGGGFVVTAAEREAPEATPAGEVARWPYPFDTAASMLRMARDTGLSIAAMKRANELVVRLPLTAAAIGGLIKHNASISGAEAGCQGEVGSAVAMAAAGLCAVLGGTPEQVENAAEIALEHHLGMTCDPVARLVQVPCIERNGKGRPRR